MPLIPALGRDRGRQISEFKASLVYKVSSRTARAIQRNPVSKKQTKNKQTNKQKRSIEQLSNCSSPILYFL
jgi:Sec-independent protein translocase protein TatA